MYKVGSLQSTEEELTAIKGNSTFACAFQKSRGIEGGHLPGGCECSLLLTSLVTAPIPTTGTTNKQNDDTETIVIRLLKFHMQSVSTMVFVLPLVSIVLW